MKRLALVVALLAAVSPAAAGEPHMAVQLGSAERVVFDSELDPAVGIEIKAVS